MKHIKNVAIYFAVTAGILLLFAGAFLTDIERDLVGIATKSTISNHGEIQYDTKVKNIFSTPIRICGGQMDWCGQGGCYKVTTPLPVMLEPGQEATIIVSISPREQSLAETELILYADGKGLGGLTPIKIKLPAVVTCPLTQRRML